MELLYRKPCNIYNTGARNMLITNYLVVYLSITGVISDWYICRESQAIIIHEKTLQTERMQSFKAIIHQTIEYLDDLYVFAYYMPCRGDLRFQVLCK